LFEEDIIWLKKRRGSVRYKDVKEMTKLEMAIRQVSDLREFYVKLKENHKTQKPKTGTKSSSRLVKPAVDLQRYI
jgi:hypothetical protein